MGTDDRTELRQLLDASLDAFLVLEAVRDGTGAVADLRVIEANRRAERLLGLGRDELVDRAVGDLPLDVARGTPAAAYARILATGEALEGRVGVTAPAAEGLWLRQRAVAAGDRVALTVRDLTAQRDTTARLRRQAGENRRMAHELAALHRVAVAVASEEDPGEVFSLVAEEVTRLLGVDLALVCRFDGERATVVGAFGPGGLEVGLAVPLGGEGALSAVHRTREPARIDSYERLSRILSADAPPVPAGVRGGVAAPIRIGSSAWGAILAIALDQRPIHSEAEGRLVGLAELVALAIAIADVRAQLAVEATTDSLTGLANHRSFHERLHGSVARARRHGRPLALVILDIDFFKRVNDVHGHQVGDQVLVEVARRLARGVRAGELLARVGGEEFGWILPDADGAGGLAAAERARAEISASPFPIAGRLTISAGVGELAQAGTPGALYRLADKALYEAKRAGRNFCWLAGPDLLSGLGGTGAGNLLWTRREPEGAEPE